MIRKPDNKLDYLNIIGFKETRKVYEILRVDYHLRKKDINENRYVYFRIEMYLKDLVLIDDRLVEF